MSAHPPGLPSSYLVLIGVSCVPVITGSKQASPNPAHWKGAEKLAVPSPPPRPPAAVCAVRAPACPLERQVWPHETSESQMLSQNRDMAGREAALFLETLTVALRTANRAAQINTPPRSGARSAWRGSSKQRASERLPACLSEVPTTRCLEPTAESTSPVHR